ncbi:MAG: TIR domain-containing protein [Methylocella sp.]
MSRIFISHSSKDNFEAVALRDWLAAQGWNDVFLDLDPERGIAAGERWERALHEAANRCEAVIFLVSANWLASGWCLKEYALARGLNKKLFAGIIDTGKTITDLPPELAGTWQVVDLTGGQEPEILRAQLPGSHEERHITFQAEGLRRLRKGLEKAGLDPRFFAWPPESEKDRAPYRGLKPLESADAGIFFGRDAPIVEATDRLRGLCAAAAPRLLVILGASGAGKSSFLRAGLLPRLARDDAHFVPLPALRPEQAALFGENGLIGALEKILPSRTRAELREAIRAGASGLRPLLAELTDAAFQRTLADETGATPPAIVIAVDQAEELFRPEGAEEGLALLSLLSDLVTGDAPAVIALFAIRSDSYDNLEHAKPFEGFAQSTLPLLPMPRGAYKEVIEGPSRRLNEAGGRLSIEPRLTEQLLADIEKGGGKDALPLLAFTLEQLYREYGAAGALRLADYESFGGIEGAIEKAVTRVFKAADADPRIPREREARLVLLRRGLIPWLAGIDPDSKSPRRNIARRADIPEEARPLIDLLVEERLLSTDIATDTGVATIEPAHEALLRQWGLLKGWLSEDFARLATLEGVKRGARDWDANARAPAWLAHQGERLAEAQALDERPDIAARLDATDRAYLAHCRAKEEAARSAEAERTREREAEQERRLKDAEALAAANKRTAQRTGAGLVAALALAALAGWQWWIAQTQTKFAQTQTQRAEQSARDADAQRDHAVQARSGALAALADLRINDGDVATGTLLALEATDQYSTSEAEEALINGWLHLRELAVLPAHAKEVNAVAFSTDSRLVVTASSEEAEIWEAETGKHLTLLSGHHGMVNDAKFSRDGTRVATASNDMTARIWNAQTGKTAIVLTGHTDQVTTVAFNSDGTRLVTASQDNTARIWDTVSGKAIAVLSGHTNALTRAVFSPDGTRVLTTSKDGTARIWDAKAGTPVAQFSGHSAEVWRGAFSEDGKRVVTASLDSTAAVWESATGKLITVLKGHTNRVFSAEFIPGSNHVVTASYDETARIWDVNTGATIAVLAGHQGIVMEARPSADGRYIVTASTDRTARIWDAETGLAAATLSGHTNWVMNAAFSPDGRRIVTAGRDRTARLWADAAITITTGHSGDENRLWRAAISPDGSRVAAPADGNTARVWDSQTGEVVVVLSDTSIVNGVAFDPSGRRAITTSGDKMAHIWDIATGKSLIVLSGHQAAVLSGAFSPDGKRIVTGSLDKTARIWNSETGELLVVLTGHEGAVAKVAFSPDGNRIITVSPIDNTVRLWDATTGNPIGPGILMRGEVWGAAFSPDGRRIVVTTLDVTLLDADTGDIVATYPGFSERVIDAAYSPDGRFLFLTTLDGSARVWNVESGRPISILTGFSGGVWSIAVSADGRRLLIASGAQTLRISHIALNVEGLIADLKPVIPRCLTPGERTDFNLPPVPPEWCFVMDKWPYQSRAWKIWHQHKDDNEKPPQPDTFEWLVWVRKMGSDLLAQKPAEAFIYLEEVVSISKELAENNIETPRLQLALAVDLNDMGRALEARSKFDEALEAYRKSYVIFAALVESDKNNAEARRDLAISLEKIGDMKLREVTRPERSPPMRRASRTFAISPRIRGMPKPSAIWRFASIRSAI